MRKKIFFIIILLIVSFFISAEYNYIKKSEQETNMIDETTIENASNNTSSYKDKSTSTVNIYKISRDIFVMFLDNPTKNILINNSVSNVPVKSTTEDFYTTSNFSRFRLSKNLSNFVCDKVELKDYLLKNNYNGDINDVAIFDTPNTPLTVWIKTSIENIFITINEVHDTTKNEFNIYSYIEYKQKFGSKKGVLIINGKVIETPINPIVYQRYADIPLLTTLEALGAQIKFINKEYLLITIDNKWFILNKKEKKLQKFSDRKNNIFHLNDGVVVFVYNLDDEFMVDSITLSSVFREMGIDVIFEIDYFNNSVQIKDKDQSGEEDNRDKTGDGTMSRSKNPD